MKQFIYTACPVGKRADDRRQMASGFGMRAMSPSLSNSDSQPFLRAATCKFPGPKFRPTEPIERLALLDIKGGPRLLLRTVVGQADNFNRDRIPFTHALVGDPSEFDARRAIRTWGSTDWLDAYDDDALDLPDRDEPRAGRLDPNDLRAFLAVEEHRAMTMFAIAALTHPTPPDRVFLYAEPWIVARVVLALTLALPPAMAAGLTFSTFEKSPTDVLAKVVGSWGDEISDDLPKPCYQGPRCAGFHRAKGGRSAFESAYAVAAVSWLADGRTDRLAEFLAEAEALRVVDAGLLPDLVHLREKPDELSAESMKRLLGHAPMAALLAKDRAVWTRVIGLAVASDGAAEPFDRLAASGVSGLRAQLSEEIATMSLAAAEKGRDQELVGLLGLLKRNDPNRYSSFGESARNRLSPEPPWEIRRVILPLLTRGSAPPEAWLDTPDGRFAELLDLRLPESWETVAWARLAARGGLDDSLAASVARLSTKQILAIVRSLGDKVSDRAMAPIYGRHDALVLFDAFVAEGVPVPGAVVDRVLDDQKMIRRKLANPAILSRLRTDPKRQATVVKWAIEDGWHRELLAGAVREAMTDRALAKLFGDEGWNALASSQIETARIAFDEGLDRLGPAHSRREFDDKLPTKLPRDYPARSEQYLIGRVAFAAPDRADAWISSLTPETLQWLVDGKGPTNESLAIEAFRRLFEETGRPPETRLVSVSVTGLLELLIWLAKSERADHAVPFFNQLLVNRHDRDELVRVVYQRAPAYPELWKLVDAYLLYRISREPGRVSEDDVRLSLHILKAISYTLAVDRVVRHLLNQDAPLGDPGTRLLEEIERLFQKRSDPTGPSDEILKQIRFRIACETNEDLPVLVSLFSAIAKFIGVDRERAQGGLIKAACNSLLKPRSSRVDLALELSKQVNQLTDKKAGFAGRVDVLERILKAFVSPDRLRAFLANHAVVAALFREVIREGKQAGRMGEELARIAWESEGDDYFLWLSRQAGGWNQEEFAALVRLIQKAKESPEPEPAVKPGLLGRIFGGW